MVTYTGSDNLRNWVTEHVQFTGGMIYGLQKHWASQVSWKMVVMRKELGWRDLALSPIYLGSVPPLFHNEAAHWMCPLSVVRRHGGMYVCVLHGMCSSVSLDSDAWPGWHCLPTTAPGNPTIHQDFTDIPRLIPLLLLAVRNPCSFKLLHTFFKIRLGNRLICCCWCYCCWSPNIFWLITTA